MDNPVVDFAGNGISFAEHMEDMRGMIGRCKAGMINIKCNPVVVKILGSEFINE